MLCTRILTMIYFKVHKKTEQKKQCYVLGISMYGD